MDIDDPRLTESQKKFLERTKKLDELIVTVLRYHVSVEQSMTELIEAHEVAVEDTFYKKLMQAEKLMGPAVDAAVWELLKKANQLRNALAHKIDGPEVKEAIATLRAVYAAVSDQAAKDEKKMSDIQLALSAFSYCGSCIIVSTVGVKKA